MRPLRPPHSCGCPRLACTNSPGSTTEACELPNGRAGEGGHHDQEGRRGHCSSYTAHLTQPQTGPGAAGTGPPPRLPGPGLLPYHPGQQPLVQGDLESGKAPVPGPRRRAALHSIQQGQGDGRRDNESRLFSTLGDGVRQVHGAQAARGTLTVLRGGPQLHR